METMTKEFRVERDSIGTREVPSHVYYGVQSLRAMENFSITGHGVHPQMINSLAYIKKAAAIARAESERDIKVAQAAADKESNDAEVVAQTEQNGKDLFRI